MKDDKEPKLWVTVLKLVVGGVIFAALVGLGLYYTAKYNTYDPGSSKSDGSWGITKDSPIPSNR
jgi:hypothetical protein